MAAVNLASLQDVMPNPSTMDGASFWNTLDHKDTILNELSQGSSHELKQLERKLTAFLVDRGIEEPALVKHRILKKPFGRGEVVAQAKKASRKLKPYFAENAPELLASTEEKPFYDTLRGIYNEIEQFLAAEANKGPSASR